MGLLVDPGECALDEPETRRALTTYNDAGTRLRRLSVVGVVLMAAVLWITGWKIPSGDAVSLSPVQRIAVWVGVIPVLGVVAGLLLLIRVARIRHLLGSTPWVGHRYKVRINASANRRPAVLLESVTGPPILLIVSAFVWRWDGLMTDDGTLRAAGDLAHRAVLMPDGQTELFVARRPLNPLWRRYLISRFDP